MLVKEANTFRSIDDIIESSDDQAIKKQLLDKKQKMLGLVNTGVLTAEKYLKMSQNIMATCSKYFCFEISEEIKASTDFELISYDNNAENWFQELIEETKSKLKDQIKIVNKQVKGGEGSKLINEKSQVKEIKEQKVVKEESKPLPKSKVEEAIEPSKIVCFKALDDLMESSKSNKDLYINLFDQKQKILKLAKEKKMTPQNYFQFLEKLLASSTNEEVSFSIKMEKDELADIYNNDYAEWFKEVIENSEEEAKAQKRFYDSLKSGKKVVESEILDEDFEIALDPEIEKITKEAAKKHKELRSSIKMSTELFCFRYIDEQIEENSENPTKFCSLFEQKQKCIEIIKNGEVDAQGYRDMLSQIVEETENEQLKTAASDEIEFNDVTGDVNEFFEAAIEETGQKYEEQEQKYNSLTQGKVKKASSNSQAPSNNVKPIEEELNKPNEKEYRPDIAEIVSFSVLLEFLDKYSSDYDYCVELKEKGIKLLKLVDEKKLGPNQYIRFLEIRVESSKDKDSKSIMKMELEKLQESGNPNKHLTDIINKYIAKTKIDFGCRESYQPEMKYDEESMSEWDNKTKIMYLLQKLSKHESLYAYYTNNKIEWHLKDFESKYKTIKKKTIALCEKIQSGTEVKEDIVEFAHINLPDITFAVLHRESKTSMHEKIDETIKKIKGSNEKIVEYTKNIKKGQNQDNLKEAAKLIETNSKEIAYLEQLKKKDFEPLPSIEEVKLEMYNLDFNKNLKENEIEVVVTDFDGVSDHLIFEMFFIDTKTPVFTSHITNGPQANTKTVLTSPPNIMEEIIKGSDKSFLSFRLSKKGWFSHKTIGECDLNFNFISMNKMEEKLELKSGEIYMNVVINVNKPKKFKAFPINTMKLVHYPEYKHNPFVEKEFMKTVMPYEKPSQSEMIME